MPIIYNYHCSPSSDYKRDDSGKLNKTHSKSCDFEIIDTGPHVYLKKDGKEVALDQHDFVKDAETLTKKSFRELVNSGAIIYKKDKFCLNCLKFKEDCICENKNIIPLHELEGIKCPKCKEGKIVKTREEIS